MTKHAALPAAITEPPEVITSYKGFDKDFRCRGFQYEVGKSYEQSGKIERCGPGAFHACEHPLDVWSYYPPATSRYAEVIQSGQIVRGPADGDTKIASSKIAINAELKLGPWFKAAITWVVRKAKEQGNGSFTQGDRAHAASQGDRAHAASQGDRAHAASQGNWAHAASQGNYAHAASQGDSAHAASQGDWAHAASQGDRAHAASQGDRAHAASQGDSAHAASQGDSAHAASQGDSAHASVAGKNSIAASLGIEGTARAEAGGAIMLAAYEWEDGTYKLKAVRASLVGENGIEPGKTYRLTVKGEFKEVEP